MPNKQKGKNHKKTKVKKPPKENGGQATALATGRSPDKRKKAAIAVQRDHIAKKLVATG